MRVTLGLRLTLAALAVFAALVPFALVLAAVTAEWGPSASLDRDATRDLNAWVLRHDEVVPPLKATSHIFHAWVFRGTGIVLICWLVYRGARRLAAWAAVTLLVAGLLGLLLKVVVDRPRPELPTPIAHFPGGSFPSGHALTAVAGSATIVLILLPVLRGAWRYVAWTAAVLVSLASGVCRVALGVHYVSDVLAGWLLGAGIVLATAAAFETWRQDAGRPPVRPVREGVEPEAAPRISPRGDPADAPPRT
ncbi:phosphatase PAP2 family protein [Spirillospora sp. NPDC047279]|uniref:phosphatase PAP2 family protein n=1 Tax=Spirillospora sp. NPDC047279 TaxID=3155478 RepID=UPI0033ED90ED